jgi:hypothetical protein
MSTRDVDAYTVSDAGVFIPEGVEISATLDSVGCAGVTDLGGDVSDGSNAGHDIFFRLPMVFIPHQQVYFTIVVRNVVQELLIDCKTIVKAKKKTNRGCGWS